LAYRLHLHEAINDYLYKADVKDINFYYRVKTTESILDKIDYHRKRETTYPVNTILNDIFGARVILDSHDVNAI
ncbi:GTP pyrophosphokinase, partial [Streptococcus suis]